MKKPKTQPLPYQGQDMSPMIDIVFNLLIFFMCATKFRTAEGAIESYLPKNEGLNPVSSVATLEEVRVRLRKVEGGVVLRLGERTLAEGQGWGEGEVSLSPVWRDLGQELRRLSELHAKSPRPVPVILDVAPEVPHQFAVSALNEVVRAEIQEVRFAAPAR